MSEQRNHDERDDERTDVELDIRLAYVWTLASKLENELALDEDELAVVGALLRAAYMQGYSDATTEGTTGQLFRDHGYRVPKRREEASGLAK